MQFYFVRELVSVSNANYISPPFVARGGALNNSDPGIGLIKGAS